MSVCSARGERSAPVNSKYRAFPNDLCQRRERERTERKKMLRISEAIKYVLTLDCKLMTLFWLHCEYGQQDIV